MRRLFAVALLLAALPAQAAIYQLTDAAGRVNCIEWDGQARFDVPQGATLAPMPQGCNPTPPAVSPVISRTQFLNRFTPAELTAISAGARTNDALNVWLITAQAADHINLADAETKQGLDALVAAGILTADREAAILTP